MGNHGHLLIMCGLKQKVSARHDGSLVILTLGWLEQEDRCEFKSSLSYIDAIFKKKSVIISSHFLKKNLSNMFKKRLSGLGMVVITFNSSTQKTDAGDL